MNKTSVIIGSKAMKHHFPDFDRLCMDTDVIIRKSTLEEALKDTIGYQRTDNMTHGLSSIIKYNGIATPYEYLFADGQKSLELILDQLCTEDAYAPIQVLYSLKKGHIHFPVKFHKHIQDYMFLRQKLREIKGISLLTDLSYTDDLLEEYPALTHLHFLETEKRVGKLRIPKMNQSTEKFFGKSKNYVTSYYVHDNMHKAIAEMHKGSPIYEQIIKDGSEVETDPELWKKLNVQERIWCVLEEVYVIALERKILPLVFTNPQMITDIEIKSAFDWALYRVCTTLCDGFFRDFAVRAYDEIQKQYDPNYAQTFFKNISKYE